MAIVYRKRETLFKKEETEWRVEDDALVITTPGTPPVTIPWSTVDSVRLAYAPTRYKNWRYVFVLHLQGGKKIEIDNGHFADVADFEDRSTTYVPFVRGALEQIKRHAPQAGVASGSGKLGYVLNLLFVSSMFILLAVVLIVIPTPLDYLGVNVIIKLIVIIALLPTLYHWIVRAKPKQASLDELPKNSLPQIP